MPMTVSTHVQEAWMQSVEHDLQTLAQAIRSIAEQEPDKYAGALQAAQSVLDRLGRQP